MAEVVSSGLRGCLWPEELDEDLSGVTLSLVVGEVGEEGSCFLCSEASNGALLLGELECSQ